MKKSTVFILLLYLIGSFFIPIQIESVKAYQDGTFYICDFEPYALDTVTINEYISGEQWLNITSENPEVTSRWRVENPSSSDKVYYYNNPSNSPPYPDCYWNFSVFSANISFNSRCCFNSGAVTQLIFYNDGLGGNEYAKIKFGHYGTPNARISLWAGDSGENIFLRSIYDFTLDMLFNISMYTNNSIRVTATNESYDLPCIEVWGNAIYNVIDCCYIACPSIITANEIWFDNITLDVSEEVAYLWTVNYDSYGSVTESYESSIGFTLTSSNPYAGVECRKDDVDLIYSGMTVRQIALAVDYGTDYSYMNINCKVNNYDFGDFDASYTITIDGVTRYILVWQSLNHVFYPQHMLVEFESVRLTGSPNFKPLYSSSDVDDDSDAELYYWGALSTPMYYDGSYGGTGNIFEDYNDLQYQVWYQSTGGGEYETYDYGHDIYLKFYDYATGKQLRYYGGCKTPSGDNYVRCMLRSDLWSGDYDCNINGQTTVHISDKWIEGSYHWINLTGLSGGLTFSGYVNGVPTTWWNEYNSFKYRFINNTEISIYIYHEGVYQDVYANCQKMRLRDDGCFQGANKKYCTDKAYYDYGETILYRMYFPSLKWLSDHGFPTDGWRVSLWDESEFTWTAEFTWLQGVDFQADVNDCTFLYLTFNATTYYGIENTFKKYQLKIVHDGFILEYQMGLELFFYCTGTSFSPSGNIVSISPDPAQPRQNIQIAYTVNNQYQLKLEGRTNSYSKTWSGDFNYYTKFVNISLEESGVYDVLLYVYNGFTFELVDDATLNVTGDYYYGGDAEYVWCPQYRYVLGDSANPIKIYYRTLINDSLLRIISPRGENTSFSTYVNTDDSGIYTINTVGLYMAIGVWNITLFGNATHYSSFMLISEEGNYIEFGKNQYIEGVDLDFDFIIKHDYYVGITLYKDNIAIGSTCRLDIGSYSFVLNPVIIPKCSFPSPTEGDWRVEMWRLNQNNKMYELSESTCTVIKEIKFGDPSKSQLGLRSWIDGIDAIYKGIVGLVICISFLFLPFFVQKAKLYKGDINPVIYSVCLGCGAIINFIFGLWAIEYAFFLCVMAGFGVFATYILQKRQGG